MEYRILRSRRKTIAIEITPRGEILVRCPVRMAKRDVQRFVESRAGWINAHLAKLTQTPCPAALTQQQHRSLIQSAKELLPRRVSRFAEKIGVSYSRITVRSQHTRWGSCSSSGSLSFNCLLMLAPEEVLDYVIVHELCHRKEMNHSPRFWAEVERILPDYRLQKQWLKEHGAGLLARLPDTQK